MLPKETSGTSLKNDIPYESMWYGLCFDGKYRRRSLEQSGKISGRR